MSNGIGKLTLVPTPIGNLDDITLRAIQVLKSVDTVLCEDTRHSGKLLSHLGINAHTQSFHQHNEHKLTERLVQQMEGGRTMALISDAGTPGISDPGYMLVRACIDKDIAVECLPGPTAMIPAAVVSGLPSDRFLYLGFPPQKKGRQTFWKQLEAEQHTMVMYESPHRIGKALQEAVATFGSDRQACVARELSKLHETHHRGTLEELSAIDPLTLKGEIVLVIEGLTHFEKRMKK